MRILVISKRQYTGRDLLDDSYGRLFELPANLSRRGHEVRGMALSYRRRPERAYSWQQYPNMLWHSYNATPGGLWRYWRDLQRLVAEFKPDLIWASSDVFHVILARMICRSHRIPLVADLYDNYESFGASGLPGAIAMFRSACRAADGVTAVGPLLAEWVAFGYRLRRTPLVIENGVSPEIFFPRDKEQARQRFGLPSAAKLMGTAGSITGNRGIEDLFDAFLLVAERDENAWLVYAGPRDGTPGRYRHERIIDLGVLSPEEVPFLLSALDVAIICNKDSAFGRYCFPQKLYEIAACRTRLVAAAVGETARVLAAHPDLLYPPGRADLLADCVSHCLAGEGDVGLPAIEWESCAERLERYFSEVVSGFEVDARA